jgi:hypothetical protein
MHENKLQKIWGIYGKKASHAVAEHAVRYSHHNMFASLKLCNMDQIVTVLLIENIG